VTSFFDGIQAAFLHVAQVAQPQVVFYGWVLFGILAVFEGVLTALAIMRGESYIPAVIGLILSLSITATAIRTGFSFSMELGHFLEGLGQHFSGISAINPQAVADAYGDLFHIIYSMPTASGSYEQVKLDVALAVAEFIFTVSGAAIAGAALETYVEFVFTAMLASFIFAFGAFEWTRGWAWGWLEATFKVGLRYMLFYMVIAAALLFATGFKTDLNDLCKPTTTSMLDPSSLSGPPHFVAVTACTNPIPASDLFNFDMSAIVLAILGVGIPFALAHKLTGYASSSGSRITQVATTVVRRVT